MAVPFDLKRLEVTGTPVPAANDVAFNFLTGAVDFDVSNTGELVYIPKGILYGDLSLAWLDRRGKVEKLPVPPRAYREPHLSPDGKQIAVTVAWRRLAPHYIYVPRACHSGSLGGCGFPAKP